MARFAVRLSLFAVLCTSIDAFVPRSTILARGSFNSAFSAPTRPQNDNRLIMKAVAAPIVVTPQRQLKDAAGRLFAPIKSAPPMVLAAVLTVLSLAAFFWNKVIWTASRTYDQEANSVGREYDAWTQEGILEYYWGEHIHLGYYTPQEMKKGYKKKNFIQAKYDFIDEMASWGSIASKATPRTILDVGCGIGGTSRYLARKFGDKTQVTGITLSQAQVDRGTELAKDRGLSNVNFKVMDALNMDFEDNTFDVVWACESGEHMPDKKKYVEEMTRVLKPGGKIVIATWCQRDETPVAGGPFTNRERKMLDFLYAEWTHPYFISIEDYKKLMLGTGSYESVKVDDWVKETIASWRHSIWVGVFDPWPVVKRPYLWWKCFRDGLTLERMHKSFDEGLMQYGMMTSTKKGMLK